MYAGGGNANVAGGGAGGSGAHAVSGGGHAGGVGHHGGSGNAYSNALAEANDLDALVFEYGTSRCKFGYAGEDFPRVYESALPSAYAAGDLPSERERADTAVANAACMEMEPEQLAQWLFDTSASRLQTRMSDHPLLFVERPFAIPEEIVALKNAAGASVNESEMKESTVAAAMTSSSSVSTKKQHSKAREQMVEVLMEQLGIPALFCAKSAVLTCYANARTSGLVVEMGATYTSVTSVHEGYAFAYPKSQVQVFGGHDLDAFLRAKLEHQFQSNSNKALLLSAPSSPSQEIARRSALTAASCWSYAIEAKESGLCRVADTAFDEAQNAQLPMIHYELPDKTVIAMGTERFSVPEQYFISATSPNGATASESGIPSSSSSESVVSEFTDSGILKKRGLAVPEWICEVGGMTTEAELRKELFQNIILTGGSSCFESMPLRLEREVLHALSTYQLPLSAAGSSASNGNPFGGNLRVKVIAAHAQERRIGAFLGGSILASLGSFHEMWMSKAEYAEHGAALVHKKCP
ncbi:Actin-like protein, partial [Globisporangium splendens]